LHRGDVGGDQARSFFGVFIDELRSCQNLDLDDINVRNAQFKNFDTMVKSKLKPVWHKVGQKTKIHVAALHELRNLQT
jgi:hypothetical protein